MSTIYGFLAVVCCLLAQTGLFFGLTERVSLEAGFLVFLLCAMGMFGCVCGVILSGRDTYGRE